MALLTRKNCNVFGFKIMFNSVTVLLLLSVDVSGVITDRGSAVSQQIYQKITDNFACFRRMNATHQVGCNSKQGGSVGVLQLVQNSSDIDLVVKTGDHSPYIALLYLHQFNAHVLEEFQRAEDRVSGVILLGGNGITKSLEYSPDRTCPNRGYGFYSNATYSDFCPKWNNYGSEILFRDWTLPIFYVSSETATKELLDCYNTHNKPLSENPDVPRDWPLCAAELDSFMYAAVDTPTCIRRNKLSEVSISPSMVCDPLGDANVWSTLIPVSEPTRYPKRSVIVVAARLDATSMFEQISPGADSAATGITALLALVKQLAPLKQLLANSTTVSNVYFILFNGESFDYIGSSRIVYDMTNDKFPYKIDDEKSSNFPALLHMEDIMYYIELNQLSLSSALDTYYVHRNWDAPSFDKPFDDLFTIFARTRLSTRIVKAFRSDFGVPPSSLQSFLAQDAEFPGLVITNHEREYVNIHYNSFLDDADNIRYVDASSKAVTRIADLVATLARTIEVLIRNESLPFSNSTADPRLVNDILECYVKSPSCQLFKTVTKDSASILDTLPRSMYVGVARRINAMTTITQHVMGFYQGLKTDRTMENCQRGEGDASKIFQYMWMNESCYETTASVTPAVSPAFDDTDNYDWKSGRYSTWTESVWTDLRVRIFLKVSKTHEILTLVSGILVFVLSIVLFSWINRNAETIFKSRITNGVNGVC